MRRIRQLALALALGSCFSPAHAAPKSKGPRGVYDLSIFGFNEGEPYRLKGAEAEAILTASDSAIYQFASLDWTAKDQRGSWVKTSDIFARFPERPPTDFFRVYRLESAQGTEVLLLPNPSLSDTQQRYAPSLLRFEDDKLVPSWAALSLQGERFRVVDIRDLNADGEPELLLGGEAGRSGAYQFLELVGLPMTGERVMLDVGHVDSLHYVDLNRDGQIEIVVRSRVGRRGPASQWTYLDQLYRWNREIFEPADAHYPRYHDEQTIPTLIGELIDNHDERLAILEEKVNAIKRVRELLTASLAKLPKDFHAKKVAALAQLHRKKYKNARSKLEALNQSYRYDAQVLTALSEVYYRSQDAENAVDAATRAIGVDPQNREAWWWATLAFSAANERSAAIASAHLLLRLSGSRDEGLAFVRAHRPAFQKDAEFQAALDAAIALRTRD